MKVDGKLVQTKTRNSHMAMKVALRAAHLPKADPVRVLDCYAGEGVIWKAVEKKTGRKFEITAIDIEKPKKRRVQLTGDNMKFIPSLDLSKFDVIDLDAYGFPGKQLEAIFEKYRERPFKAEVFVTFIKVGFHAPGAGIPRLVLEACGYSKDMIKKCPTLFMRNALEKVKIFLAENGVSEINRRSTKDGGAAKHYFHFTLDIRS